MGLRLPYCFGLLTALDSGVCTPFCGLSVSLGMYASLRQEGVKVKSGSLRRGLREVSKGRRLRRSATDAADGRTVLVGRSVCELRSNRRAREKYDPLFRGACQYDGVPMVS